MNITIDIGNTHTKAALFEKDKLVQTWLNPATTDLAHLTPLFVIISSVGQNDGTDWKRTFPKANVLFISHATPLPFRNHYATPHTLGLDRIAGVAGVLALFPQRDCLVIDAGTCITYDLLEASADYRGGGISLGLHLRAKALHVFTARLPLVENLQTHTPLIGTSTQEAIASGIVNGMVAEIEGIIAAYTLQYPDLKVVICGGDANFLKNKMSKSVQFVPDLVHIGLNKIAQNLQELSLLG